MRGTAEVRGAPVAGDGKESRVVGKIPRGEGQSEYLSRVLRAALTHYRVPTLFIRLDRSDDGAYRITYSPDPNDIPTDPGR